MSTSTNQPPPDQRRGFPIKGLAMFVAGLVFLPLLFLAFVGYLSFDTDKRWLKSELETLFAESTGQTLRVDGPLAIDLGRQSSLSGQRVTIKDQQDNTLLQTDAVDVTGSVSEKAFTINISRALTRRGELEAIEHRLALEQGNGLVQQGAFRLKALDPLALYEDIRLMSAELPKLFYPEPRTVLNALNGQVRYRLQNGILRLDLEPLGIDQTQLKGRVLLDLTTLRSEINLQIDEIDLTDYVPVLTGLAGAPKKSAEANPPLQEVLAGINSKGVIKVGKLRYGQQQFEAVEIRFE